VKNGALFTPAAVGGALYGITRQTVIDWPRIRLEGVEPNLTRYACSTRMNGFFDGHGARKSCRW